MISHRTAAALYGLMPACGDVHVTVPGRNPGYEDGRPASHRVTTLSFNDVVVRDGLTLTSPARTICDVAGTKPLSDAERALNEARVQRLVTDSALERVIEANPDAEGVIRHPDAAASR